MSRLLIEASTPLAVETEQVEDFARFLEQHQLVRPTELGMQRMRAQGTAFIVVSHYLQMIESLQPDQVLRLDQGRIAETGGLELARSIAETGFTRATA